MEQFLKISRFFKQKRDARYHLVSILAAAGLPLVLFCILMVESSRVAYYFYQALIVFPVFLLTPGIFLRLWRESFLFRWLSALLLFFFLSVFWSDAEISAQVVFKFIRRILYTQAFIGAIALARPVLNQYRHYLAPIAFLGAWGAARALMGFFENPDSPRLVYHIGNFHPIVSSQAYGLIACLVLTALSKKRSLVFQAILMGVLSIIFLAVMFASSRGGMLGAVSCLVAFVVCVRDRRMIAPLLAFLIAVGIYSSSPAWCENSKQNKHENVKNLVVRKDAARLTLWEELVGRMSVRDHLIGTGFLSDHTALHLRKSYVHPHNLYLFSYYHGGAIALLLHVGATLLVLWRGTQQARRGHFLLLLLVTFAIVPSLTEGIGVIDLIIKFPMPVLLFWIPAGLAVASETFCSEETPDLFKTRNDAV